ncbi:MAG: glutamate--tRNA ligase family protein [Patescibacteria group bacterium]
MTEKTVRVRFAPSPTGFLHLGSARTALFNFLFARKNAGKFILRIEDTDKERDKPEYEKDILENLEWLGIKHDEFFRQSERLEIYKKYLRELLENGVAYVSEESEGDRKQVIRFKNLGQKIVFNDLIKGEISFDTKELGDFVIAKSLDEPIFHFANVVDDREMGITHIIRGEDHISNTARQILIWQALSASSTDRGGELPSYAHIPLILAPDRAKLSKRQHGETVSIAFYREQGYLPEALVNYLALLGWNPGNEREIFSLAELIELFDLAKVQQSGAIFNVEKLEWLNREHLKKISNVQFLISNEVKKILRLREDNKTKEILDKIAPIVLERISKFGDIKEMAERGELAYFFQAPEYPKELLLWKKDKDENRTRERLIKIREILRGDLGGEASLGGFASKEIKDRLMALAEKEGRGEVLWPLRVALSGREKSPDPLALLEILGKEQSLIRIDKAINILE